MTDPTEKESVAASDGGPRVWIACLASYVSGSLHGEWVDATSLEALEEGRKRVLASSSEPGAEETAIHDYDGFGSLAGVLGEYPSLAHVAAVGSILADLDEGDGEAFIAWYENDPPNERTADADELLEAFRDAYVGQYDSLADYAAETHEDTLGIIKDALARDKHALAAFERLEVHIDWENIGRDLQLGGDVWTADAGGGRVHVFRNV